MKLYRFAGRWQVPGQQDRKAERVEIPTDSRGLCDWLNALEAPETPQERDSEPSATQVAQEAENALSEPQGEPTCFQIEEFLLDTATVAQVERIFSAIGTRFAELRK